MLATGEIYHIFNKSIAEFKIFNNESDFSRITKVIRYYQNGKLRNSFSNVIKIKQNPYNLKKDYSEKDRLVEIIAYCVMPTHFHLILKQLKERGISTFMNNIQNSYSRYFNIKHNRKGPLWEGRFKNVLVETDEYLLHLTRYIHLNPVTAYLVGKPEDWPASSYREYLLVDSNNKICNYKNILDIKPRPYREFVNDRVSYQRELAKIKHLLID